MSKLMEEALKNIQPLNRELMEKAQQRLDNLTKPIGSLGCLEQIAKQLVGISGKMFPTIDKKCVIIMCADNGVTEEGVSSCPKNVTAKVTNNFTKGITGINVFTKQTNSKIAVVDIGVDANINNDQVINKKIKWGTDNIAKGPAMTRNETIAAIEVGIEIISKLSQEGFKVFGTGEMGIGNTTTSSAILSVYSDCPIENVVGKGSGLTKTDYANKINVIKTAIKVNKPDKNDPIDVLSKIGGLDIAGMVGCYIGAAYNKVPILIDGFISGVAALLACKINPLIKKYIIPSHGSDEPGTKYLMQLLELEPLLNLHMRLGEGTGAAIAFHIIDDAIASYTQMGTFNDANIEKYKPLD